MELRWGSCQESSSVRLWKWYVTVYGNGMLPLMEMVCYRFRQPLMEMVCYRLSSYLPVMQPFMEMVGTQLSH
jgi:hypothetical protein